MHPIHMYHREGKTDLQKMRDMAARLAVGDKRNEPTEVLIHHHQYEGANGNGQMPCGTYEHETFALKGKDSN